MNIRLNANAIVTNSEGKILLIRLKKGPFAGGLCIPGGGVDPGELGLEAVKREVLEETQIQLKDATPIGYCELIHRGVQDYRVVLLFHSESDEPARETDEGYAMWLDYSEAKSNLIPFAAEAIRMWKEKRGYFRLVGEETGVTKSWKS